MREENMHEANGSQTVIPLLGEELSVTKRRIVTGRVRVATICREREELVDELLSREQVEIERTPVGKQVARPPPIREEGDTLIIPVVEEVLVVERRLLLKEEVRVRRVRGTERHQERVNIRRQDVVVTRYPVANEEAVESLAAEVEKQTPKKEK
jgi:uncharacterized protein (TIGR02271 family)